MVKKYICTVVVLIILCISCSKRDPSGIQNDPGQTAVVSPRREEILAQKIVASMSNPDLAAQVLMTGIDGEVHLRPGMVELLQEIPAGAVMLFKYNLTKDPGTIRDLLAETTSLIKTSGQDIPPFIAVDHEGGDVHRFASGVTRLPPPRMYWDEAQAGNWEAVLENIRADAFSSGRELSGLGINMNLAPIAEIENRENILFLDNRSYGPDPAFVASAVSAFAEGMSMAGVVPVLKHFPGSSGVDPHTGVAVLKQDRTELDAMVVPFRQAIKNGRARGIMISHSIIPALDPDKNGSLSSVVIQDWLYRSIGFDGIIIADDFSMKAVSSRGIQPQDAVIEALNSGVNLVMVWPRDLRKTRQAIVNALESGTLSRETLELRAEKILLEKINLGVIPFEPAY